MRKVLIALAATAVAAAATPALANEARIEARGGVVWLPGDSKGTAGMAAGYDVDLGRSTFAGVEVSGDKALTHGTRVAWGFTGRAGVKAGDRAKLFVDGGYTTKMVSGLDGNWHAGGGVNYDIGHRMYLTTEYRHYFRNSASFDHDSLTGGVGVKF